MQEFKITKEQLELLFEEDSVKEKLSKWFPEVFGNNLQVGHWYKNLDIEGNGINACVLEINPKDNDEFRGSGTGTDNNWYYDNGDLTYWGAYRWQELTDEETTLLILKEAKKRGLVIGAKVKGLGGDIFVIDQYNFYNINNDKLVNIQNKFNLAGQGIMGVLFRKGKWAEIVE